MRRFRTCLRLGLWTTTSHRAATAIRICPLPTVFTTHSCPIRSGVRLIGIRCRSSPANCIDIIFRWQVRRAACRHLLERTRSRLERYPEIPLWRQQNAVHRWQQLHTSAVSAAWEALAATWVAGTAEFSSEPNYFRGYCPPPPDDRSYVSMAPIAKAHGCSPARVSLAWLLAKPVVTSVIIGAKRLDQFQDNLAAVDLTLTEDGLRQLDEISALPPEYPGWVLPFQGADRLELVDRWEGRDYRTSRQ
jgi:hypothetical protein